MSKSVWLILLAIAVVAGALIYARWPRGVMPLDAATLETFQEANSRYTRQLLEQQPGMNHAVRAALGMKKAIRALGYSPDDTLLHWMSGQHRADIQAGDPKEMIGLIRLTDSLLATALGDSAGSEDFLLVLDLYSARVREAAQKRRGVE